MEPGPSQHLKMTEFDSPSGAAAQAPSTLNDIEKQASQSEPPQKKNSTFKNLGLLDQFLAVWIFLAMAIGIILGNFVPSTGPALQRGKFVGVSVPIGKGPSISLHCPFQYANIYSQLLACLL
jgi:ACR3 family arsenite transporter